MIHLYIDSFSGTSSHSPSAWTGRRCPSAQPSVVLHHWELQVVCRRSRSSQGHCSGDFCLLYQHTQSRNKASIECTQTWTRLLTKQIRTWTNGHITVTSSHQCSFYTVMSTDPFCSCSSRYKNRRKCRKALTSYNIRCRRQMRVPDTGRRWAKVVVPLPWRSPPAPSAYITSEDGFSCQRWENYICKTRKFHFTIC